MEHDQEVRRICATAYLEHVRSLKLRIDAIAEQIEPLREMVGTTMDCRERVSKTPNHKSLEESVIRLQELIADYCTEMAEFVDEQRSAHDVICRLSKPERARALAGYYVNGKSWEMLCVEMGYSWQGMMSLRKRAVDEVYDLMPEQWRRDAIPNAMA